MWVSRQLSSCVEVFAVVLNRPTVSWTWLGCLPWWSRGRPLGTRVRGCAECVSVPSVCLCRLCVCAVCVSCRVCVCAEYTSVPRVRLCRGSVSAECVSVLLLLRFPETSTETATTHSTPPASASTVSDPCQRTPRCRPLRHQTPTRFTKKESKSVLWTPVRGGRGRVSSPDLECYDHSYDSLQEVRETFLHRLSPLSQSRRYSDSQTLVQLPKVGLPSVSGPTPPGGRYPGGSGTRQGGPRRLRRGSQSEALLHVPRGVIPPCFGNENQFATNLVP